MSNIDPNAIDAIPQAKITNLVSDLAGKAASSHTHSTSDITNFTIAVAAITSSQIAGLSTLTIQDVWAYSN